MTWPLNSNKADACAKCRRLLPVGDPLKPGPDELGHYQPSYTDPEQYLCGRCKAELEGQAARVSVKG